MWAMINYIKDNNTAVLLQGSMIFLSFLSLVKTRNRLCGPSADNGSRLVFNTLIVRDTRAVGGSVRH